MALLAACLLPACSKAPENDEAILKAGLDALNVRNDPQEAIGHFYAVLLKHPNHYQATIQYAMALDRAGNAAEARHAWRRVSLLAELHHDTHMAAQSRARLDGSMVMGSEPTAEAMMQAGLDALYRRADPNGAAVQFRKVLMLNPEHYGATFQLAKALDQAGRPAEARAWWNKVLRMAEQYSDTTTSATARSRLARSP